MGFVMRRSGLSYLLTPFPKASPLSWNLRRTARREGGTRATDGSGVGAACERGECVADSLRPRPAGDHRVRCPGALPRALGAEPEHGRDPRHAAGDDPGGRAARPGPSARILPAAQPVDDPPRHRAAGAAAAECARVDTLRG